MERFEAEFPDAAHRAFAVLEVVRGQAEREQAEAGQGRWFGAFVDGRLVSRQALWCSVRVRATASS